MLGLGRVLELELVRQDVPGLKNTGVNFLVSGRSRQDVADPLVLSLLKFGGDRSHGLEGMVHQTCVQLIWIRSEIWQTHCE